MADKHILTHALPLPVLESGYEESGYDYNNLLF